MRDPSTIAGVTGGTKALSSRLCQRSRQKTSSVSSVVVGRVLTKELSGWNAWNHHVMQYLNIHLHRVKPFSHKMLTKEAIMMIFKCSASPCKGRWNNRNAPLIYRKHTPYSLEEQSLHCCRLCKSAIGQNVIVDNPMVSEWARRTEAFPCFFEETLDSRGTVETWK